ncbi:MULTISPECIES: hypothetical protein [unclassified Curtobacterium]|uniref:hypothetical protein n=1 Tax=unclassified Curtobacterium TaxID=257496 RepID=UPI00135B1DD5|nr:MULTISPECIES: hypothetical protein [unclassified Curtobacterium]MBF4588387.1 hypothetical protein [Curtobacterium sp. VKM Ac-2887]
MYGGGNGLGPTAGGLGVSALAYTGTGSMLLPLVVTGLALALGIALLARKRWLSRDVPA